MFILKSQPFNIGLWSQTESNQPVETTAFLYHMPSLCPFIKFQRIPMTGTEQVRLGKDTFHLGVQGVRQEKRKDSLSVIIVI